MHASLQASSTVQNIFFQHRLLAYLQDSFSGRNCLGLHTYVKLLIRRSFLLQSNSLRLIRFLLMSAQDYAALVKDPWRSQLYVLHLLQRSLAI